MRATRGAGAAGAPHLTVEPGRVPEPVGTSPAGAGAGAGAGGTGAEATAAPGLGVIRRGMRHYVLDGWKLGGIALTFVRHSRPLQRFVIVAALGILLAEGAAGFFSVIVRRDNGGAIVDVLEAALATYLLAVATTAASVGLAGIVADALDGHTVRPTDGWRLIVRRRGAIVGWSAIDLVFGLPARIVGKSLLEQVTVVIFGFGWGLLSFFVMPAIALTQVPAHTAAREALHVVRQRWGTAVSGMVYLWLRAALIFGLPGVASAGVGILLVRGNHNILGALFVALGAGLVAVAFLLATAARAVLAVVLYRFAESGTVTEPFSADLLVRGLRPPSAVARRLAARIEGDRVRRLRERILGGPVDGGGPGTGGGGGAGLAEVPPPADAPAAASRQPAP